MRNIFIATLLLIASVAYAGMQDGQLIRKGSWIEVKTVSVSSTSVTTALTSNSRRVDFAIRHANNSYDLLVTSGTTVATSLVNGFPVKSGETFSPDGFYPGNLYLIMDDGASATTVNVVEFYRQEY